MRNKRFLLAAMVMIVVSSFMVSGCAVNFYKQSPRSKNKIQDLEKQIDDLERQRMEEQKQFEETKKMLESRLQQQIDDESISLSMDDRGLVIVLSDEILFDSGKAEVKANAGPVLDKVSKVIVEKVPEKNIGVSGHTDNVPITRSSWKSNWELSTARATNVLHHMVSKGVSPAKLSATGYGEHRPVASNSTPAGRAKNRRVEIVILPDFVEKRESVEEEVYVK